jgi:hypothetical protein
MNRDEKNMLREFLKDFNQKEEKRKLLRNRIVKALDRIEMELYDDKDSSNEGLLTRVNNLDEAFREIASMVKRTKIRNDVIIGIIGTVTLAIATNLFNHYMKIF